MPSSEERVSLSSYKVNVQIAVSDLARARRFYEGKLGLCPVTGPNDQTTSYPCAGGTTLHVYASPHHASKSTATVARWDVDDIERVVDELTSRGVTFERYDGFDQDEKGIARGPQGPPIAWLKDPAGNILAVLEQT